MQCSQTCVRVRLYLYASKCILWVLLGTIKGKKHNNINKKIRKEQKQIELGTLKKVFGALSAYICVVIELKHQMFKITPGYDQFGNHYRILLQQSMFIDLGNHWATKTNLKKTRDKPNILIKQTSTLDLVPSDCVFFSSFLLQMIVIWKCSVHIWTRRAPKCSSVYMYIRPKVER